MVACLLAVVVLAAGCADEASERRFANEPIPTEDLAALPSVAPTVVRDVPAGQLATPVPVAQLVGATGPASGRFVITADGIRFLPAAGGGGALIAAMPDGELLATAESVAGDAFALLLEQADERVLLVVGPDGAEQLRVTIAASASATPGVAGPLGRNRLAWSPDGGRMLVALDSGGIVEVSRDGATRTLLSPTGAPSPRAIAWSPGGGAIAFADGGPDGQTIALYVASVDALPIDPVVVVRPSTSRARQINQLAWIGGNAGILFSQRAAGDDLSLGGDLFAVSPNGGQPRLIAAAGGASQVGVVGDFAVSGDGRVVGYTVLGVVNGRPGFTSLWLRQIDGPASVQVPASGWDQASDVVWTTAGLTWRGSRGADVGVERLDATGTVTALYASAPEGTPVASPSASPIATPAN